MHSASRRLRVACLAGMFAFTAVHAQNVERLPGNPALPFIPGIKVPAGYDTYYFSGATATVVDTGAPKGSYQSFGDIATQTRSALDSLKASLAKFGLTFGDVVQARVFMSPDPSQGGGVDFAAMSKVWLTEFGSPAQPNKPVRAAVEVAGLIGPGLLIEIEMIAVKKASSN